MLGATIRPAPYPLCDTLRCTVKLLLLGTPVTGDIFQCTPIKMATLE